MKRMLQAGLSSVLFDDLEFGITESDLNVPAGSETDFFTWF